MTYSSGEVGPEWISNGRHPLVDPGEESLVLPVVSDGVGLENFAVSSHYSGGAFSKEHVNV